MNLEWSYYTEWSKLSTKYEHMYMEFRKTGPTIPHAGQQRRHGCKEQTSGLYGRRRGWDDLREQHWNMYTTTYKADDLCNFNA